MLSQSIGNKTGGLEEKKEKRAGLYVRGCGPEAVKAGGLCGEDLLLTRVLRTNQSTPPISDVTMIPVIV